MAVAESPPRNLVANMTAFVRLLRANGITVGPGEAADALRAVSQADLLDRREFYFILRTVLIHRVDSYPAFDRLFHAFWRGEALEPSTDDEDKVPTPAEEGASSIAEAEAGLAPAQGGLPGEGEDSLPAGGSLGRSAGEAGDEDGEGDPLHDLFSPASGGLQRDLGTIPPEELPRLQRLAERLARRLAVRLSRRLLPARRGAAIDLRRSLRQGLKYGGDPLRLLRRRHRIRKPRLVILCDVSGSMRVYASFLLPFIHALQCRLPGVESFLFSTQLTRITPALRSRSARQVLAGLPGLIPDWGGGTRTGECLAEFNRGYGLRLLGRRSVLMILSDGIDTGETEVLQEAIAALRRQTGRILWLNPVAGDPRYEPRTAAMQAVLPHLDLLAPAHSLESLMHLERMLTDRPRAQSR